MVSRALLTCAACVIMGCTVLAEPSSEPAAESPTKHADDVSAARAAADDLRGRVATIVNEEADIGVYGLFAAIQAVKAHAADLDDASKGKVIADLGKLLNYKLSRDRKYDFAGGTPTGVEPQMIWENLIFRLFATLKDPRAIEPLTTFFYARRATQREWNPQGRTAQVAKLIEKLGGTVSTQPATAPAASRTTGPARLGAGTAGPAAR